MSYKDIIPEILNYLQPAELLKCGLISKEWYKAINNKVWHNSLKKVVSEIRKEIYFKVARNIIHRCTCSECICDYITDYKEYINYKDIYFMLVYRKFNFITLQQIKSHYNNIKNANFWERPLIIFIQLLLAPVILLSFGLLFIKDLYNYNIHKKAKKLNILCNCHSCI